MQFIAHDYNIITSNGIQLCRGYIFNYKGLVFGIDHRDKKEWVITDIKTGLKVMSVEKRKDCCDSLLDVHLKALEILHKDLYIKYHNKMFIAGNQKILDLYGGVK